MPDQQASTGLWDLFAQSFDVFTVVLLLASVLAVGLIVRVVLDVRPARILDKDALRRCETLVNSKRPGELRAYVSKRDDFVCTVLGAALAGSANAAARREAAEVIASERTAYWFRRIELLNVIGNLAPLVGLAGTVWGMILAFTSLGAAGGQAGPTDLSLGISKALFHTLLGLCLAIPCLAVHGVYRSIVDRVCTRGIVECSRLVDRLPDDSESRTESGAP